MIHQNISNKMFQEYIGTIQNTFKNQDLNVTKGILTEFVSGTKKGKNS